jgi:hypothetical protein
MFFSFGQAKEEWKINAALKNKRRLLISSK